MDLTIHVNEAGSLINQIDLSKVEEIESLTISGYLNGTDILVIRKMRNLKMLDMANVSTVNGGNSYYQEFVASENEIGDYFFYGSINPTNIVLPNNVTRIGQCAFKGLTNLETINIPNDVLSIGFSAFWGCVRLNELKIGNKVEKIENAAFYGCTKLTNIKIPDSVSSIGGWAFQDCKSLTLVDFGNGLKEIYYQAFKNCSNLSSVVIPKCTEIIDKQVFSGCESLISVTIEDGSNTLYLSDAFDNCPIVELYIGRSICENSFSNLSSLTTLTISHNVVEIGNYCFQNCKSLKAVIIPNSIKKIGIGTFFGSCNHASVTIEQGNDTLIFQGGFDDGSIHSLYMGRDVEGVPFARQSDLTSVTFSDNVTYLNAYAFCECTNLESCQLPNSITTIGQEAFRNCTSLTSFVLPESINSIDYGVFQGCNNLSTLISLNTTPPAITESTFDYVTYQNATLKVPINCKTIYWLHPYWENFHNIEEKDFSSVPEIILEEQPINTIYDINGILRRDVDSNSLPNGIYIINGKKTLINR